MIKMTRHERLRVPKAVMVDPDKVEQVRTVITLAEDVATSLVLAAKTAVREALAPASGNADAAEVTRLVDSLAPERHYWFALAESFDMFLDRLARDATEAADAVFAFEKAVQKAAHKSLAQTIFGLGTGARQLQGGAKAERQLALALGKIIPKREDET